jgi:uncharacterized protein
MSFFAEWTLILTVGLAAGVVGGVVGFGASILLLPVLVWSFGAKEAVPLMALAALLANASRVAVWWREVDWKVNAVYCSTAVPAAALGARLLVKMDVRMVEAGLGAFLLAAVPLRRWLIARGFRVTLPMMAVVGAGIGFLTGLVASTGPINTPFFLGYGLSKGAYIASEALGSAAISLTKATVFHSFGALPRQTLLRGLLIGTSLMAGAWISKRIVQRMDASQYQWVLECMMIAAGLYILHGATILS